MWEMRVVAHSARMKWFSRLRGAGNASILGSNNSTLDSGQGHESRLYASIRRTPLDVLKNTGGVPLLIVIGPVY